MQTNDREQWCKGLTKERLAQLIAETGQETVPEIVGAVSQPIQMRTNKLLAGVRSDVAVLIYGTNLNQLRTLGSKVGDTVGRVRGTVDVRVEQVAGLKYLRIVPDRSKLARYGLTIEDVNQITEKIAVGYGAGEVLEGERRFGIRVKTLHGYQGDLEPF